VKTGVARGPDLGIREDSGITWRGGLPSPSNAPPCWVSRVHSEVECIPLAGVGEGIYEADRQVCVILHVGVLMLALYVSVCGVVCASILDSFLKCGIEV
jgi:hypothetical protein